MIGMLIQFFTISRSIHFAVSSRCTVFAFRESNRKSHLRIIIIIIIIITVYALFFFLISSSAINSAFLLLAGCIGLIVHGVMLYLMNNSKERETHSIG